MSIAHTRLSPLVVKKIIPRDGTTPVSLMAVSPRNEIESGRTINEQTVTVG